MRIRPCAGQCGMAIHDNAEVLAVAGDFHAIPIAGWFLDLVRPSKALYVLPGIAAGPIESGDVRPFGHAIDCKIGATDHENVARATFDNLRLKGFGPDLIFADKVDEDAAV